MAYSYKGAISFGLVYIPITLTASIKNNDIGFNMIDRKTMSRVKYKKTCVDCQDREVKNDDIVKGYQYDKDKYVIFEDEDFEKIKSPKDKNIVIEQFVDLSEIDPIYFDKAYYVQPQGADRAFSLLLEAMKKENKAGIAKTVLGTKETLILIRASEDKMLLNTMFFNEEVQACPVRKSVKVDKKELTLAINLIEQMTQPFKPEKYKDEYREKVMKAIERKIAGNKIVKTQNKKQPEKIINIMEALQKSLKTNKTRKKVANDTRKI